MPLARMPGVAGVHQPPGCCPLPQGNTTLGGNAKVEGVIIAQVSTAAGKPVHCRLVATDVSSVQANLAPNSRSTHSLLHHRLAAMLWLIH